MFYLRIGTWVLILNATEMIQYVTNSVKKKKSALNFSSKKLANWHTYTIWVFGMTQHGIEFRSPEPLVNTLPIC